MPPKLNLKKQEARNRTYFYLQRRVPVDILRTVPPEVRKGVLGTSASLVKRYAGDSLKEAERSAAIQWVAIEEAFDKLRAQTGNGPSPRVDTLILQAIAWEVFMATKEGIEDAISKSPNFDPMSLEISFGEVCDPWREGLRDNTWSREAKIKVAGELARKGILLSESDPYFFEALRLIGNAILEAHETMTKKLEGDYTYQPQVSRVSGVVIRPDDDNPTLSKLFEDWKAERKPPPTTEAEFAKGIRRFTELHGDIPAIAISKTMIRQFKEALRRLPPALSGNQLKMRMPELLEVFEKSPPAKTLSAASINKHIVAVSAVLAWAGKSGYFDSNPNWTNPTLGLKSKEGKGDRISYTTDDLKALFTSPVFFLKSPPKGGSGEAAKWLPLIGLFTGARLEEIGQLLTTDIREERGVSYFDINTLDEGKRLKTESSKRKVPIHPELIRCGFMKYVEERRKSGDKRLFPLLKADVKDKLTGNWSKWYGRYIRSIGIKDQRKVFHSFRHTFKDACRAARIEEEVHDSLTGHSSGRVGRTYGDKQVPLEVLKDAVSKIKYDGLDLGHLYPRK